ncbi:hypothetical protein AAZX31_19G206300 [Glycine max]
MVGIHRLPSQSTNHFLKPNIALKVDTHEAKKENVQAKVAIVTGGATRIGAEAVKIFVENGASADHSRHQGRIGSQLGYFIWLEKVSYRHCDAREEKQVEETVSFTLEKYGSLDIQGPLSSILDFDNAMAVNLRGAMATIICTASVAGSFEGCAGNA